MTNNAIKKDVVPLQTTITLLALGIAGYFIKVCFNIYLARKLPAALYGDFSVALTVLNIAATFILLGTNVSANRFLSRYLVSGDQHTLRDYLAWNLRIVLASSFVCFLIIIFILGVLYFLHISNVLRLEELHLSVHLLWISPLVAMALLMSSFLLCNQNYHLSYFFQNVTTYIFMFFFFIVGFYFFDSPYDTRYIVAMVLFAFIMTVLFEIITFRIYMPENLLLSLKNAWQKPTIQTREWTQTSIRLISNNITYSIVSATTLVIIKIISPHKSAAAYFAAALVIANVIFVISSSIYNYLKPQIGIALAKQNYGILQKKLDTANIITYSITLMITILINVFSAGIFSFFGDQFAHSAQIALLILSVGYFIGVVCKPAVLLLAYSGNEKILLKTTTIELCTILILGFILTYFYAIEGAALAETISLIVKSGLAYLYVKRLYPLRSCLIA